MRLEVVRFRKWFGAVKVRVKIWVKAMHHGNKD